MNWIRKYWKELLIAAGILLSAVFYVRSPEGKGILPDEEIRQPETEEIMVEIPEQPLQDEGFSEVQKEEIRQIISECLEEIPAEVIRKTIREEFQSVYENGMFSEDLLKYCAEQESLININTADARELETLNGIGKVKAASIISYREKTGGFQSVEELMEVEGISAGLFEKIRERITAGPQP